MRSTPYQQTLFSYPKLGLFFPLGFSYRVRFLSRLLGWSSTVSLYKQGFCITYLPLYIEINSFGYTGWGPALTKGGQYKGYFGPYSGARLGALRGRQG